MTDAPFNEQAQALAEAFQAFNRTTQSMEEAYRRLESRVRDLDAELAAKNQALAFTTDYLNSILESISDGVVAIDTNGRITTFNRAATTILGYEADGIADASFADVFGRAFTEPKEAYPLELRASDGTPRLVTERDSPLADKSGRVIGAVKVFQDIGEIEDLRERVRRKDRLAALGEMAATVAHEIRNPLGGIRGFASLLARDLDDSDPKLRLVEKVIQGTKALDKVVNDLLEYTRPMELRIRPTDLADLIEPALGFLGEDSGRIIIKNEVVGGLRALADADRMRQVILNLLLNAAQSIDGPGRIHITAVPSDTCVELVIADTGCGMTSGELERAFMPFHTTKEKGAGLGLPSAAKIVEGHGGAITAESEPGRGSRFTVRLPKAT